MSKVKYRVREFVPKGQQSLGNHSWFAEVVINNDVDNDELAKKIAARTGFKSYECQAIVAAIADIVAEEVLESNRVSLANEQGTKLVSFYPKVTGSISDADVQKNQAKYPGKTVAEESMLTPDMLTWTLGATVGIKFSQQFALNKQAQKVKTVSAAADDDEGGGTTTPDTPDPGTGGGGTGTVTPDPGTGGDNGGGGGDDNGGGSTVD